MFLPLHLSKSLTEVIRVLFFSNLLLQNTIDFFFFLSSCKASFAVYYSSGNLLAIYRINPLSRLNREVPRVLALIFRLWSNTDYRRPGYHPSTALQTAVNIVIVYPSWKQQHVPWSVIRISAFQLSPEFWFLVNSSNLLTLIFNFSKKKVVKLRSNTQHPKMYLSILYKYNAV